MSVLSKMVVGQMLITDKQLSDLKNIVDISCEHGTYDYDPYFHGMANGLLMAESVIHNTEPNFLEAPKKWLGDMEVGEVTSSYDTYEVISSDYTLDYVLKNPNPKWPDTVAAPALWKESIYEYLRRIGIKDPESLKKSLTLDAIKKKYLGSKFRGELIEFPEVKRLFNRLAGHRKNRPRNEASLERKNKEFEKKIILKERQAA